MTSIKIATLLSASFVLAGCTDIKPRKDKFVNDFVAEGMSLEDAGKAYKNQYKTDILVYVPDVQVQTDDSRWINQDNLAVVSRMVTCPPSENAYSFDSVAKIQSDGVHVVVNRSDCSVDRIAVKRYFDAEIDKNKIENSKRIANEIAIRETSPVGPFVIGCQDYQRQFKGQEIYSASSAVKEFYKINSVYVLNLYKMGFDNAQYYSPNADCKYVAIMSGIR